MVRPVFLGVGAPLGTSGRLLGGKCRAGRWPTGATGPSGPSLPTLSPERRRLPWLAVSVEQRVPSQLQFVVGVIRLDGHLRKAGLLGRTG